MNRKIKNHNYNFLLKIFAIIFLMMVLSVLSPLFTSGCKLNHELKEDDSNTFKEFNGIIRNIQNISIINKSFGAGIQKVISVEQSLKHLESKILISAADRGFIEVTKTNLVGADQAKLSLYYMDGSNKSYISPSPQTVANNGVALWTGLAIDKTYYVEESFDSITNVYTYNVINPVATIDVDSATKFEKTVKNDPKYGSIEVTKIGLKGNDQAKLSLYFLNDSRQKVYLKNSTKIVSAKNPKAIWTNLEFNKYYLEESFNGITNVYTYDVINPVATIDVDSATKFEKTVKNDPKYGFIEVTKTNLVGADQAKLSLYYMDGSNKSYISPSPQTVANNGVALWTGLAIDKTYYAEESFDGITNTYTYNVINPVATIDVDSATKFEKTVKNDPKYGFIEVTKTGLEFSDQANLSLYNTKGTDNADDDVIVSTSPQLVSNNEKAIWSNLPYEKYYIVEDFNGIKTNVYTYEEKEPLAITLDTAKKTETFVNTAEIGSIEVIKTGLEFSDQANLSLYNTKGTDNADDDVIVSTSPQVVSNNEKVVWTNLSYGIYYVVEDFNGIKTNVYTYEEKEPLAITLDTAKKTDTFVNTAETGSIEVTKENLLGGDHANLSLYYLHGSTRINISPSPQTVSNNGKAVWTGFPLGKTYYIEESFNGITNVYTYNVINPVATIDVDNTIKVEKTLKNNPKYGSITIIKKDIMDGSILSQATFGIFNKDGTTLAIGEKGKPLFYQVSDSEGKVHFTKLAFGTYIIKEISPPEGYSLAAPVTAQIGQENKNDVLINVQDLRIPGFLKIIKVDSITNLPVDGAQYYIFDGKNLVESLITDSDGIAYVSGLSWFKEYVIKESKAPEGYLPDSDTYMVSFSPVRTYLEVSVRTTPAGGIPVITIAGINEVYSLLDFQSLGPDILISGAATLIFGLSLIILYSRKRHCRHWKHASGNINKVE